MLRCYLATEKTQENVLYLKPKEKNVKEGAVHKQQIMLKIRKERNEKYPLEV